MSNILEEGNYPLVPLDYQPLLTQIINLLSSKPSLFSFSPDKQRLIIRIDQLAQQIGQLPISSPLLASQQQAKIATINFSPDCSDRFPLLIQKIRDLLQQLLPPNFNPVSLLTPLRDFKNKINYDLSYSFATVSPLIQQQLELNPQGKGSNSYLKFHKITIAVQNLTEFQEHLKAGLKNYSEDLAETDADQEDLEDLLEDLFEKIAEPSSDLYYLLRLVDQESLGQLKKEAALKYLKYLEAIIPVSKNSEVIYLQDLNRRLQLLKDYFHQGDKPDDYYQFYYQGVPINLRLLLARADAFDALPIFPILTGYLGETTDSQLSTREFVFGVKLKLNGPVQTAASKSSFLYHLDLINPSNQEHQEESKSERREYFLGKVFRIVTLYHFCLASRCCPESADYQITSELDYSPDQVFENRILPILKGDNDAAKQQFLQDFSKGLLKPSLAIKSKINKLAALLKKLCQHQTILNPQTYSLHLELEQGLLEKDLDRLCDRRSFFQEVVRKKEAIQYLTIGKAALNPLAFCQLTAQIKIEDIRYYLNPEQQHFTLDYDLANFQAFPVIFSPTSEVVRKHYKEYFKNSKAVVFPYDHKDEPSFNYSLTFFLLVYLCLEILTSSLPDPLFIPILRLHLQSKPSENKHFETQVYNFSKVLVQLLNEQHLCNSQGLNVKEIKSFKAINAWNSLYSVIPKNFRLADQSQTPKLDKLAMIIVSSRDCDASWRNPQRQDRLANLVGEVVTINHLGEGVIQVKQEKRLSANYSVQQMFTQPQVILDTVVNLYHQGYRHILYLAKAPYTSTLQLTVSLEEDNLFFLSRGLIKYLYQQYQDFYLYPIFFDKYYVRKVKPDTTCNSLYLQDTRQLQELLEDPNQQAVVFFNLFNGLNVKRDDFYNGVICYATLVGIYGDILDDQGIRQNLIYDDGMKTDILRYLTLFHYSRYEKYPESQKQSAISIKLDPYEDIIGDESVGKLSLIKHSQGKADFNTLAFLTAVRKALSQEL